MCGTWEPVVLMSRETLKWKNHKSKSTDAGHRGGTTRSSEETSVMGGGAKGLYCPVSRVSQLICLGGT